MIGLFFIYTSLHLILYEFEIGGFVIGKHAVLLPTISICTILVVVFLIKSKKNFQALLKISYFIILVLVVYNVAEISFYSNYSYEPDYDLIHPFSMNNQDYRDVYHIISDEHSGTSAMQKYLNYDNSNFDSSLEKLGFFIPEKSFSTYADTILTIPSMLNLNYIDSDLVKYGNYDMHQERTSNNLVTKIFEQNGYEMCLNQAYP